MISGVGGDSTYKYDFSVSGTLEEVATNGSAPISEGVITTGDIEDSISGKDASGAVAGGGDAYRFTGSITDFDLTGSATVYLDGKRVDPDTLGTGSAGGENGNGGNTESGSLPAAYRPPLDAKTVAASHRVALETAGSFSVESTTRLTGSGIDGAATNTRHARVDLDADTAYHVSSPNPNATTTTYAEGKTAYQRKELAGFDQPDYEVTDMGRSLADRLVSAGQIGSVVDGVNYRRAGTLTRDGRTLVKYTASGTDAVTDTTAFGQGTEDLSAFSSTLLIDPDTGLVARLHIKRTTDAYASGDGSTTVETTLRFHDVGSTTVEQPGWVDDLKQ